MMMAANLVGFALGLDGLKGLVHGIVGSYSGQPYFLVSKTIRVLTFCQGWYFWLVHVQRCSLVLKSCLRRGKKRSDMALR